VPILASEGETATIVFLGAELYAHPAEIAGDAVGSSSCSHPLEFKGNTRQSESQLGHTGSFTGAMEDAHQKHTLQKTNLTSSVCTCEGFRKMSVIQVDITVEK